MNPQYETKPPVTMSRVRGPQTDICAARSPMLPMLLNDIAGATTETYELVEQLEKQLSDITQPEDSVPSPPENKVAISFPPALEMLRTILNRVQCINRNLSSLKRRVEL